MGGDYAPRNTLAGAQLALAQVPNIETLFLTGDESRIRAMMEELGFRDPRVEIVHAPEVVEMSDSAVSAVRRKRRSSIVVAVELVKSGEAQAVVSAGHTGAAVAAATLRLRTLPGIDRAGILTPFPNLHGTCHLIDAGANVDSRPIHLVQHALMGHVYSKYVDGVESPIVGLMSNGEEDTKGNEVTQIVFERLRSLPELNFKGNVEGRDILNSPLHVAVVDGFTGNILLKGAEGTARAFQTLLRNELTASPWRKLFAKLLKPAFRSVAGRLSYESYGGSPLLGVNGVVIIAHGSSSALAIKNAIRVAGEVVRNSVNPHIAEIAERLGAASG